MNLPTRNRTPIVALIAVVLGLLVVGGILLVGRIGVPDASPRPTASGPAPSATDPMSTPEGAVRAFFDAYSAAGARTTRRSSRRSSRAQTPRPTRRCRVPRRPEGRQQGVCR